MWNLLQDELGGGVWSRLLVALVDRGAKGFILMAAAGLAAAAMRRNAAAARHLVWMLALCGLLLLPVVSVMMPKWTLPILPALEAPAPPAMAMPIPPIPGTRLTPANYIPASVDALASTPPNAPPMPALQPAPTTPPNATPPRPAPNPVNLPAWALAFWLTGALLAVAPFIAGTIAVARLRRRASTFADSDLQALSGCLAQTLALKRPARLLRAPTGAMPMATGFLSSAVFLPADALAWSEEKRRVVLLHELAHVKRRDCLTHAIARTATSLHWFNPLAWLALRQLRIEREHACDDLVLVAGERPSAYAENLLEIARILRASTVVSAAAITMAQKSQLEGRLLAVLDAARNRGRVTKSLIITSTFSAIAVITLLAVIDVARSETNGAKFELKYAGGHIATVIGVSDGNVEKPEIAWGPDGALLPAVPESKGFSSWASLNVGKINRRFYLKIHRKAHDASDMDFGVKFRVNAKDGGESGANGGPRSAPVFSATFDKSMNQVGFDVGIASGPWQTVTQVTFWNASVGKVGEDLYSIVVTQPYNRDGQTCFSVTHSLENEDWRIVVFDKENTMHKLQSTGGTGVERMTQTEFVLGDIAPEEVERIELQVRDYEWKTFEGIAMNPDPAKAPVNSEISEAQTDLNATPDHPDGMAFPDAHVVIYNGERGSDSYAQHDFGPRHGKIIPGPIGALEWTYHGPAENGWKFSFRRFYTPDFPGRDEATADVVYKGGTVPIMVDEHQWIGIEPGKIVPVLPPETPTLENPTELTTDPVDRFFAGSRARQERLLREGIKVEFVQRVKNHVDDPNHVEEYLGTLWMLNGNEVVELRDAKGRTARHYQIEGHHVTEGPNWPGFGASMLLPFNESDSVGAGRKIGYPVKYGVPGFNIALQWRSPHEDDESRVRELLDKGLLLPGDAITYGMSSGIPYIAVGAEPVIVAPPMGFAWLGYRDVTASDLIKIGSALWFPRKVVYSPSPTLGFDGKLSSYHEELAVIDATLAPQFPEGLFDLPTPNDGDLVFVDYASWNEQWNDQTDVSRSWVLTSVNSEATFNWGTGMSEEDRGILEVSVFWRLPGRAEMALDSGQPLPFFDRQANKVVWARYDSNTQRIIRLAEAPTSQAGSPPTDPNSTEVPSSSSVLPKPFNGGFGGLGASGNSEDFLKHIAGDAIVPPAANTSWGSAHFGLQAAVRFLPEKAEYALGEAIGMEFLVRNAGPVDVEFLTSKWRNGDHCIVTDEKGEKRSAGASLFSGINPVLRVKLAPGEVAAIESASFTIMPEASGRSPLHPVGTWARSHAGIHKVQFRIHFPDSHMNTGELAPRPGDWTGTLMTGERTISLIEGVVAKAASPSLQVRWVATEPDPEGTTNVRWREGNSRAANEPNELLVENEVLLSAQDIESVRVAPGYAPGKFELRIQLNEGASERWASITQANIGRKMAIVLNDEIVNAPTLNGPIADGSIALSGDFSELQAQDLAAAIRAANPALNNDATGPDKREGSLGPEVEVTVRHSGENCMIDFDMGKLFTPPDFDGTEDAFARCAKNGIDAGGGNQPEVRGLIGMDLVLNPEANTIWNNAATNGALNHDAFKFGKPGNPVYMSAKGDLPATWTFKTREGGLGIVQILGFEDEEPRGVKIRYRMWEK